MAGLLDASAAIPNRHELSVSSTSSIASFNEDGVVVVGYLNLLTSRICCGAEDSFTVPSERLLHPIQSIWPNSNDKP